ncbi:MAG: hypothetical protein IJ187_07675 [Neisseriaceae bacterium]|nr:hypothetical protein [Neisseriaceae bacterium]
MGCVLLRTEIWGILSDFVALFGFIFSGSLKDIFGEKDLYYTPFMNKKSIGCYGKLHCTMRYSPSKSAG